MKHTIDYTLQECLSLLAYHSQGMTIEDFIKYSACQVIEKTSSLLLELVPNGKLRSYLLKHPDWYHQASMQIKQLKEQNIHILHVEHPDYPKNFYKLPDPPLFLTYQGQPVWKNNQCLSVVGSREPTTRALQWMETHLKSVFAEACSVSGGARGIDQKAHNISLRLKRPTVVFLPSGLKTIYPQTLSQWSNEIIEQGGAIVSEYLPEVAMQKHHFHRRNRLIAAIGDVLLVVEARIKSGTLLTANLASAIDQSLAVVPTFPDDVRSQGNLKLLLEGVQPVASSQDLLSLIHVGYEKRKIL